MQKRLIPILVSLVSASATLPTVIVVAGLMAFPSSCTCGGPLPHDHALFVLSSHRHPAAAAHEHDAARTAVEADRHGVAIEALSTSNIGEPHATLLVSQPDGRDVYATALSRSPLTPPACWTTRPVTPPPRA
jgi:hypothetical protein